MPDHLFQFWTLARTPVCRRDAACVGARAGQRLRPRTRALLAVMLASVGWVNPVAWAQNAALSAEDSGGVDGSVASPAETPATAMQLAAQHERFSPSVDRVLATLLDADQLSTDRRDAARWLLLNPLKDPDAMRALIWVLRAAAVDPANEPAGTTALIADAVLNTPSVRLEGGLTDADDQLSAALWRSVLAFNGTTRPMAVDALVRLQSKDFLRATLIPQVSDPQQPVPTRVSAAEVLAGWGGASAFRALAQVVAEEATPSAVKRAATQSLNQPLGLSLSAQDWSAWWAVARDWPAATLEAWLVREVSRAGVLTQRTHRQTVDRLVAAMREAYWALDPGQQSIRLAKLIGDAMPDVRGLGLEIAALRIGDGEAFDDTLRASLRHRMADPQPKLRTQATRLLSSLKDTQAAEVAAGRLQARFEQDPEALSALLQLLARVPQRQAVVPAMGLLEHPQAGLDAASFLAAAVDAGFVNEAFAQQIVDRARHAFFNQPAVRPQWLTLLVKLGDDGTWSYIEALLDHEDEGVRQAAAQAFASDTERPLTPLAEHGDDPSLQSILYSSARSRGRDPKALLTLIGHRPDEASVPAWFEAVNAMIGRVPPRAAVRAIDAFAQMHGEPSKQLLLISAVLAAMPSTEAPSSETPLPADAQELMLRRGLVRLALDQKAEALGDLEQVQVIDGETDPAMARAVLLARARCQFSLGQFDEGLGTLTRLTDKQPQDPTGLEAVVDEATRWLVTQIQTVQDVITDPETPTDQPVNAAEAASNQAFEAVVDATVSPIQQAFAELLIALGPLSQHPSINPVLASLADRLAEPPASSDAAESEQVDPTEPSLPQPESRQAAPEKPADPEVLEAASDGERALVEEPEGETNEMMGTPAAEVTEP